MDEQPLSTWGSGTSPSHAVRAGGVVLTEGGAWTPAVLALLRHLEEAGFDGAPRVVGDGRAVDGRMTLTYVPGESPHPHAWPDATVHEVGALLRRLHDATSTFVPAAGAGWQPTYLRAIEDGDMVLGHGDAAPWNIVGRDGVAAALVDWEYAGPVDRMTELAYAAWLNAQLHDDDVAELQGLPDAATRAHQFCTRSWTATASGGATPRARGPHGGHGRARRPRRGRARSARLRQ